MKAGVLIIGSLLWDNDQNGQKDLRKNWRNENLSIEDKIHVFAPIRYGRKSNKGKTFTMVLSKEIEQNNQMGTAFIVPFKNEINSFDDLLNQIQKLSKAENYKDENLIKGEEQWCIIGILFNPIFDKTEKEKILSLYQEKLQAEKFSDYYQGFKLGEEPTILKESGEIDIAWLNTVNSEDKNFLNSIDFVIATCTKPENNNNQYPTSEEIINILPNDTRKYFHNNIENGIRTFQDKEVLNNKNTEI